MIAKGGTARLTGDNRSDSVFALQRTSSHCSMGRGRIVGWARPWRPISTSDKGIGWVIQAYMTIGLRAGRARGSAMRVQAARCRIQGF
jgi:hypothetical protein